MTRLTARFWVDAYFVRLRLLDIPAFVVRHGDDTAGAVLVKLNTLDGKAKVYQRGYDLMMDKHRWSVLSDGAETEVDLVLERQLTTDPDLWVIEVEDRQGRHLLEEEGLA